MSIREGGDRARLWSVVENHGEVSDDGTQRTFNLVRASFGLADNHRVATRQERAASVSYRDAPKNVRSLDQRIRNLAGSEKLAVRRRISTALVVVGQMLPEGAVKGGSAMALRYGRGTRFTQDLDVARVHSLARFRSDFQDSLAAGWGGFSARLVAKAAPRPVGGPSPYVMQPFEVKLDYRNRAWCTVKFELGHNELGDADEPELRLADDLLTLFSEVGLETPAPVRVLSTHHQSAQKLHAVSAPGSERARDLVDLQLLLGGERPALRLVHDTCVRLFAYRRQQAWPPVISAGPTWATLYAVSVADLAVPGAGIRREVGDTVLWANDLVRRIAASTR